MPLRPVAALIVQAQAARERFLLVRQAARVTRREARHCRVSAQTSRLHSELDRLSRLYHSNSLPNVSAGSKLNGLVGARKMVHGTFGQTLDAEARLSRLVLLLEGGDISLHPDFSRFAADFQ